MQRRWNGWGNLTTNYPLAPEAHTFLNETLGAAKRLDDAELNSVLAKVPESRISQTDLICTDPETRVRHTRGQSLPDWLAMRSGDFGLMPDAVAFPETTEQVRELLALASKEQWHVIPYGGGTSVAGHITPEDFGKPILTLSLTRMNKLIHIDKESQIATFGAGTMGPAVEAQLAEQGYTLGHFPQSFELSTIGGWVATRSSGQQSLRYGKIEQMFAGGIIETPIGQMEIPAIPATSAGLDLREMFMGSEGRMGIITEVKVRVTRVADHESFHVGFFPNWDIALTAVRTITQNKIQLSMLRLSNPVETYTHLTLAGHPKLISWLEKGLKLKGIADGKCMVTFGLTGSKAQCRAAKKQVKGIIRQHKGMSLGTTLGKKWEHSRFRSPYLREELWKYGYAVDTVETAINWNNTNNLINGVETAIAGALQDEDETVHVFTHLSHVYTQGSSAYTTYLFRLGSNYEESMQRWKKLKSAASNAIVDNGGTISHQHGVGTDHAPYLHKEKGPVGMSAIKQICSHFDPEGIMNPGKLILEDSKTE